MKKCNHFSASNFDESDKNDFISLGRTNLYSYLELLSRKENTSMKNQSFLLKSKASTYANKFVHQDSLYVYPNKLSTKPLFEMSDSDLICTREISKIPCVVLYGENGSGKTEFLRWIRSSLAHYSKNFGKSVFGELLPLFIDGKENDCSNINSIYELLNLSCSEMNKNKELVESVLNSGQAILLIDNADYLNEFFIEETLKTFSEKFNKIKIIFTAKNQVPQLSNATSVYLLPFNESQKIQFIENWFSYHVSINDINIHAHKNNLLKNTRDEAYYAELAKNPYFLNILCFSYMEIGMIGREPHYLMEEFVINQLSLSLFSKDEFSSCSKHIDVQDILYCLRKLAWMMHCGKINIGINYDPYYEDLIPLRNISKENMIKFLEIQLDELVSTEGKNETKNTFFKIVNTGIMKEINGNIHFSSQVLQDYLAGSYCVYCFNDWKFIEKRMKSLRESFNDDLWKGAFLFCKKNGKIQSNKIINKILSCKN